MNENEIKQEVPVVLSEVKGLGPKAKAWLSGLRTKADALMVKFGVVKTASVLVLAWAVYFLVGRFVIGTATDVVAFVSKLVLGVIPVAIHAVPYLVVLALGLATLLFIIDVVLKKKA